MTDLSISVVSYRTPELLRACLTALADARALLDCAVTVVDNASGDDSADLVAREFPWVDLVRNECNRGFGAAHNQTLRDAGGRYALILNSDTVPQPGALAILVRFMDAHPDVAVCGPKLRYPDGSVQPSRRRLPTLLTLFCESTQIQRFVPRSAIVRHYYVADRSDDELQDVDWLVGACLCVRTAAMREVGLFDERFFMYSEELDWCRRMRAAGWRIAYVPGAEVRHLEGGSARLDLGARDRHFQTSKLRYIEKWHGQVAALLFRAFLVLEYSGRAIEESLKLAVGSRRAERRARLKIIGSGLRQTLQG